MAMASLSGAMPCPVDARLQTGYTTMSRSDVRSSRDTDSGGSIGRVPIGIGFTSRDARCGPRNTGLHHYRVVCSALPSVVDGLNSLYLPCCLPGRLHSRRVGNALLVVLEKVRWLSRTDLLTSQPPRRVCWWAQSGYCAATAPSGRMTPSGPLTSAPQTPATSTLTNGSPLLGQEPLVREQLCHYCNGQRPGHGTAAHVLQHAWCEPLL